MPSWRRLVEASIAERAAPDFSVYSLAQLLIGIAHQFPGRVGQLFREFDVGIRPIDISDFGKDVLPLPRPSLDVYRQLQQGTQSLSRSKRKHLYQLAAIELWTYLAVMGLNFLYVGSRGVPTGGLASLLLQGNLVR